METPGSGSLTKHSDEGLGSSHRHSEDGAGVLALIGQGHVADADAELVRCGADQLNPIVSEGWGKCEHWKPGFYRQRSCYLPVPDQNLWGRGPVMLGCGRDKICS